MLVAEENLNQIKGLLHYLNENFDQGGGLEISGAVLRDKETAQELGAIDRVEGIPPYQLTINQWSA